MVNIIAENGCTRWVEIRIRVPSRNGSHSAHPRRQVLQTQGGDSSSPEKLTDPSQFTDASDRLNRSLAGLTVRLRGRDTKDC